MNQFSILTSLYAVLLLAYGLSLWAGADPRIDSVTLTANSHEIPNANLFSDAYTAYSTDTRANQALATLVRMMPFCLVGDPVDYLLTVPSNLATTLKAEDKALFDLVKAKTLPIAWDKRVTAASYAKLKDEKSPQFVHPWCKCAKLVLDKYIAVTAITADKTNEAFKSCIATQFHITKQKIANFNNEIDDNNIDSRKSLSRYSFLVLIVLAYLFNSLYSMLEFGKDTENKDRKYFSTYNDLLLVLLFLVFVGMLVMPLMSIRGAPWQNILAVSSFVIVPSFLVEFLLTEIAWSYLYNYKRRTSFTHPFPFFVTLFSLHVLALIENGVFNIDVIVTYFFASHAVTFLYAALLFFLHYHCAEWVENDEDAKKAWRIAPNTDGVLSKIDPSNIMAYFGVCVVIASLMFITVIPQFPTYANLNVLWFYPLFYVLVVVGGAVWIEHLFDGNDKENTAGENFKLELTSHLVLLANAVLVLSICFYFTGDWIVYNFGDSFYPNGGSVLNRPIYSLAVTTDGRYVTP